MPAPALYETSTALGNHGQITVLEDKYSYVLEVSAPNKVGGVFRRFFSNSRVSIFNEAYKQAMFGFNATVYIPKRNHVVGRYPLRLRGTKRV